MHGKSHARKGVWVRMNDKPSGIYLVPMVAAYDSYFKQDCYVLMQLSSSIYI